MKNKLKNNNGEARRRNILITVSLVLSIVTFLILSSAPAVGSQGTVTTSVLSVRLGDASIEKINIDSMLAKEFMTVSNQEIINP